MPKRPRQDVYSLWVHGIGTQEPGYSSWAQKQFAAACSQRNAASFAREVYYADLFAMQATAFLDRAESLGSKGNMAQRLSVNTLADALQWQANPKLREEICCRVDEQFLSLRAPKEVVVFAHSLGCLVILEWLRTRTAVKHVSLITMGFNAGIFNLGGPMTVPPQVGAQGSWVNLFDPSDALGFPAHASPELAHVIDAKVEVGGFISGNTGLAHVKYFETKELWTQVIPNILGIA